MAWKPSKQTLNLIRDPRAARQIVEHIRKTPSTTTQGQVRITVNDQKFKVIDVTPGTRNDSK